jgi:energy-coupling factor transporter ATP-binding protein EcfA2
MGDSKGDARGDARTLRAGAEVYFVGASGVGKSTLAGWLAAEAGLRLLASPVSDIYKKHGVPPGTRDTGRVLPVQREVVETLTRAHEDAHRAGAGFVSDRSIDALVYSEDLVGRMVVDRWVQGIRLAGAMKSRRAVVFFVRPYFEVLRAARKEDRGRRETWLHADVVNRIDELTGDYLGRWDIPYVPVHGDDLDERKRLVWYVLRSRGGRCEDCGKRCLTCEVEEKVAAMRAEAADAAARGMVDGGVAGGVTGSVTGGAAK